MRAISPNRQTGVATHLFSPSEQLADARSPPESTRGSGSPLWFGQDLVKVSMGSFQPAPFAFAIRKAWIHEPSRRLTLRPKPSIRMLAQPDPRISHASPKDHESPGPTGVQEDLLGVAEVARQVEVCTATVYTLCAQGQLPPIRILNAIRIPQADVKVFVAARRAVTQRQ